MPKSRTLLDTKTNRHRHFKIRKININLMNATIIFKIIHLLMQLLSFDMYRSLICILPYCRRRPSILQIITKHLIKIYFILKYIYCLFRSTTKKELGYFKFNKKIQRLNKYHVKIWFLFLFYITQLINHSSECNSYRNF